MKNLIRNDILIDYQEFINEVRNFIRQNHLSKKWDDFYECSEIYKKERHQKILELFYIKLKKESKMSEKNKCLSCGQAVGNDVFTYCDDCWDMDSLKKENEKIRSELKKVKEEYKILNEKYIALLELKHEESQYISYPSFGK